MEWLNLKTSILHAPEYIGSDPRERAAWFNVCMWCAQQENGGRIVGARAWKDRQWQQTCGVSRREVDNASKLLTWDGVDVIVWNYPTQKQAEVQAKREAGRLGGLATTEAKTKAVRENGALGGRPSTQAETKAVLTEEPKQNLSTNLTEGKGIGREGEGKVTESILAPTGVVAEVIPKNERPRDLIFEALAKMDNVVIADLTPAGRGSLNKARSAIVNASPGVTAEEINRRHAILQKMYPNATMSASALAKHWARCASLPLDPNSWAASQKRQLELDRIAEDKAEADAKAARAVAIAANPILDASLPSWATTVTAL